MTDPDISHCSVDNLNQFIEDINHPTLNEEESELFEQMQQIMERLDYIRQLRSQVLNN